MEMCKICSIPYPNNKNYKNSKIINRIHKIEYIKNIIQDLENYGPGGLIHIAILSNIIQRPIKIWNVDGSLNKIIGKKKTRHPIDIEYHAISSEGIGHWTLRGEKDPDNVIVDLNSCLFSVIGSQIGQDPLSLRKWTQLKLKANFQNLVKWIDKTLLLERNDKTFLMIGGVHYKKSEPHQIESLLKKSSKKKIIYLKILVTLDSPRNVVQGHAFKHASHDEDDEYGRIETYSITEWKTGFLSRGDLYYVVHLALKTPKAQKFMAEELKHKLHGEIFISFEDIEKQRKEERLQESLPKARKWDKGWKDSCQKEFSSVKLWLGNFKNKMEKKEEEEVCILDAYPVIVMN